MNKKFFTLLAASLTLGTASAFAQCPDTLQTLPASVTSGDVYYLRYYAETTDSDVRSTNAAYSIEDNNYFAITSVASGDSVSVVTPSEYKAAGYSDLWIITKTDGKNYRFQNKATGNYLTLGAGT